MSPARRPFSARTQQYARARAEANMTSTVRILRRGKPTTDPTTLVASSTAKSEIYAGKARVRKATGSGVTVIGEMDLDTRTISVGIPWDAPVPRQDDIVVVDTTTDADLVSRVLQIREVDGGGLLQDQRNLTCTTFSASSEWVA